jgi:hypothetical protein
MNYLIVDTKTGAWDGVYTTREGALAAFESLTNRLPQAAWVLQEHHDCPKVFPSDFWVNVFDKEI